MTRVSRLSRHIRSRPHPKRLLIKNNNRRCLFRLRDSRLTRRNCRCCISPTSNLRHRPIHAAVQDLLVGACVARHSGDSPGCVWRIKMDFPVRAGHRQTKEAAEWRISAGGRGQQQVLGLLGWWIWLCSAREIVENVVFKCILLVWSVMRTRAQSEVGIQMEAC